MEWVAIPKQQSIRKTTKPNQLYGNLASGQISTKILRVPAKLKEVFNKLNLERNENVNGECLTNLRFVQMMLLWVKDTSMYVGAGEVAERSILALSGAIFHATWSSFTINRDKSLHECNMSSWYWGGGIIYEPAKLPTNRV